MRFMKFSFDLSTSHFFHAVQTLNIKKPHFKKDVFRFFSLKIYVYIQNIIVIIKLFKLLGAEFHYRHRLILVPKYMHIQLTVLL